MGAADGVVGVVTAPPRGPPAVGVNLTLIVQLAPAATPLPQVFD
jgi:hypothetical protein